MARLDGDRKLKPKALAGMWKSPMDAIVCVIGLIAALPMLYGLHHLGLYLERRGLIHYWHTKPRGGIGYNPLEEIYQPQIRHAIQVQEQRLGDEQDDEGATLK